MEGRMKDNFLKCDTQVNEVNIKCDNLKYRHNHIKIETVVGEIKPQMFKLENGVSENKTEADVQNDKFKEIEENYIVSKKEVRSRDTGRIVFRGDKYENPMKFLHSCGREMHTVGTYTVYITYRRRKGSNGRPGTYSNDPCTELRVRLEYGIYQPSSNMTSDKYERTRHLKPKFPEAEIVTTLAHYFNLIIRTGCIHTRNTRENKGYTNRNENKKANYQSIGTDLGNSYDYKKVIQ